MKSESARLPKRDLVLPCLMVLGVLLQGLYFEWQLFAFALVLFGACAAFGIGAALPRITRALLLALVLMYAISCVWAVHLRGAIVDTLRTLVGVLAFTLWFRASHAVGPRVLIAFPVALSGFITALVGLAAMDDIVHLQGAVDQGRLGSLLQYANGAGALFAASFVSGLALWVGKSGRPLVQGTAAMIGSTSLLCLIHTLSRGAWIATALGCLSWFLWCGFYDRRAVRKTGSSVTETMGYLLSCVLSVAFGLWVSGTAGSLQILGSHILGVVGSAAASFAYCMPDLLTLKGAAAWEKVRHYRPYVVGVLSVTLFALSGLAGPTASGATLGGTDDLYVTKPGDTLTSIAQSLPVPISGTELYAINRDRIRDPQNLEPGLELVVTDKTTPLERAGAVLGTISLDTPTFQYRIWAWKDGLATLISRPWGLGGGGWESAYGSFQTKPYTTNEIHSAFLDVALDSGVIGLGIFVAILGSVCIACFKVLLNRSHNPLDAFPLLLAIILLIQGSVDLILRFTGVAMVYWACLGASLARAHGRDEPRTSRSPLVSVAFAEPVCPAVAGWKCRWVDEDCALQGGGAALRRRPRRR